MHASTRMPIAGKAKDFGVTFVKPTGERVTVRAPLGDSMLEVAHANGIDIEGACGGETACSTCHVILDKAYFDKLPQASEEEEDMLDLAAGLTPTSRLGCQVCAGSVFPNPWWPLSSWTTLQVVAAPEVEGMVITLPKEVNNMQAK